MATASFDGSVKIWEIRNDSKSIFEVFSIEGKVSQNSLDWAPSDSPILASVSSDSKLTIASFTNSIWQSTSFEIGSNELTGVSFLPNLLDKKLVLAIASGRDILVRSLDPETKQLEKIIDIPNCHKETIYDITWNPIEDLLASVGEDGLVNIYKFNFEGAYSVETITVDKGEKRRRAEWNIMGTMLAVRNVATGHASSIDVFEEDIDGNWVRAK